jgi:hypothetical protein
MVAKKLVQFRLVSGISGGWGQRVFGDDRPRRVAFAYRRRNQLPERDVRRGVGPAAIEIDGAQRGQRVCFFADSVLQSARRVKHPAVEGPFRGKNEMTVKDEKNNSLGFFLDDNETPLQHFAEDFQLVIVILGKLGKRKVVKIVGQQIGHLKQFDPVGGGTEQ